MFIEELILEGFKSYASRTTIQGWDREFNAITGLNGSGKSNVLDAIVFVLGITNYSQVRASNLQDLVYKRGQAGITKASVTVVFNNADREESPIGYEACKQISVTRQILIGGRNKYIINGHNAQAQAVQNLFQSVQLNVNNPHFLIMQGRITKVLNMKPPEILAMIEEAAGTRMFEEKKDKALKTIAKKDSKVEEITALLTEEIGPKLDKLRAEKRSYLEFQKLKTEIERIQRLVVAFEYTKYQQKLDKSGTNFATKLDSIGALQLKSEELKKESTELEKQKTSILARREKDMGSGGRLQELESTVKEYLKQLVRIKTQCDLKATSIEDEEKFKASLLEGKLETERSLAEKRADFTQMQATFEELKKNHDEKAEEVRKSEELLQTLSTGVSAEEGHENGYMEQLQDAKSAMAQAQTEAEQAKIRISHMQKQLAEKKTKVDKAQKENSTAVAELSAAKKAMEKVEAEIAKMNWDPAEEAELLKQKAETVANIAEFREKVDALSGQVAGVDFQYTDPTPNFQRSKVKGLVAQLTCIPEQHLECSTALEICAGGRLYNVVVDDEVTGTQLLQKGRLRKRVTIIPLNKIQAFVASAQKLTAAQRLAPGKINLALTLVGYDEEVATAMQWVFGSTLICKDSESAKLATFDKAVRMKSVTLDGDVYDPSGTLSGGSKPSSSGILVKLQNLRRLKEELKIRTQNLEKINERLEKMRSTVSRYNELQQQMDLKTHEITLLEEEISKSVHSQITQEIVSLTNQLAEQQALVKSSQEKKVTNQEMCKRLESEMKDFKNNRDGKLKEMTKTVSKAKADLSKSTANVKEKQRQVQTLDLELKQLDADFKSADEQIRNVETSINALKEDGRERELEAVETKDFADKAQEELDQERIKMTAFDEEVKDLAAVIKSKNAEYQETILDMQRLNLEIKQFEKEKREAEVAVKNMEKTYEWIEDQKQHFGQPNTAYDFKQNPQESKTRLRQLEENHEKMRKTINIKVMNMIDSVEKKELELKKMLKTVINDKKKIEGTIASLDNFKRDALYKTWEKVNGDFGAIFGDLLANCSAKLDPPEGQAISAGLEVKVCLGGVWKQSLTELSGGQRSLIALSLILSLLQFKPAPMYILDEVDAALDLSHTQNIGTLLRTRFKGSQFIVVSLKEGMFNNANVLFRAKFRDGISVVERTENRKKSTSASHKGKENADNTQGKNGAGASTAAARQKRARVLEPAN